MCLILNAYRGSAAGTYRNTSIKFFVELDEDRSLQNKDGYTKRIACWHYGCCCPHKET